MQGIAFARGLQACRGAPCTRAVGLHKGCRLAGERACTRAGCTGASECLHGGCVCGRGVGLHEGLVHLPWECACRGACLRGCCVCRGVCLHEGLVHWCMGVCWHRHCVLVQQRACTGAVCTRTEMCLHKGWMCICTEESVLARGCVLARRPCALTEAVCPCTRAVCSHQGPGRPPPTPAGACPSHESSHEARTRARVPGAPGHTHSREAAFAHARQLGTSCCAHERGCAPLARGRARRLGGQCWPFTEGGPLHKHAQAGLHAYRGVHALCASVQTHKCVCTLESVCMPAHAREVCVCPLHEGAHTGGPASARVCACP